MIIVCVVVLVWTELEKENKEFFEDYHAKRAEEKAQMSISGVDMLREKIEKMVLDSSSK